MSEKNFTSWKGQPQTDKNIVNLRIWAATGNDKKNLQATLCHSKLLSCEYSANSSNHVKKAVKLLNDQNYIEQDKNMSQPLSTLWLNDWKREDC